jgi:dTDP-glucose 4,6-dehydratase
MKRVLVTGGAGFIGSNFVRHLLAVDPEVRIIDLDALTYAGDLENLEGLPDPARHEFLRGDICDRELVEGLLRRHAIDTIVHFAAETHVDRSIEGPNDFLRTNVLGTATLLEAARAAWLVDKIVPIGEARFHHISTDEVYGSLGEGAPPFSETTPFAPNSPYAASKAASDHLVKAYGHTYGLPFTITNCSNNYGPRQHPEKLIPLTIVNALQGSPLPLYGDGLNVRDWLYVDDHCEAIVAVLRRGQLGEVYHVGGGTMATNLDTVQRVCEILDGLRPMPSGQPHASLIRFVSDRPGHDRRYAMDTRKIERELGWKPQHALTRGLLVTVKWYLDHPGWVNRVRNNPAYQSWLERNYGNRGGER